MAFWDELFKRKSKRNDRPAGLDAVPVDKRVNYPELFDPALKQFEDGFRKGEPVFKDPGDAVAWRAVRVRVLDQILKVFAESDLRNSFVVRGSVLLKHWIGSKARRPKDVDWVVMPEGLKMSQAGAKELLSQTVKTLRENFKLHNVTLECEKMVADDIWTYDRAPGKRLVIPWRSPDVPSGFVQMDFVFEEELWCPPIEMAFPGFAPGATLLAASPEQSLAWKLLWLSTDMYAEGKDLYDAVLLAEKFPIDFALLRTAYSDNGRLGNYQIREDLPLEWSVDWNDFHREYPKVVGTARDWQQRLCNALTPAFDTQLDEPMP